MTQVKHLIRLAIIFCLGIILWSCKKDGASDSANMGNTNLNWQAIADKLAERMDIQKGERVVILSRPSRFDPLIPLLREKIKAAGGEDFGVINADGPSSKEWGTFFTKELEGKNLQEMTALLEVIDLGIMMPGVDTEDQAYVAIQEVLRRRLGRTIHFHWSGAYDLNGNALGITPEIDAFYERVLLETDYEQLAVDQKAFEEAMRGKRVYVKTLSGTAISFEIADRPVTRQDGDATAKRATMARNLIDREIELPAGAIRVAPFERTVEGEIVFPDAVWNGGQVRGLRMQIKEGFIQEITADEGADFVKAELADKGQAGQRFREFALGFNPLLAIPADGTPWIPYYGYGAGVVRLSLGDNTELGGKVEGPYVRWNFFTDATVVVGDEVWVQDGKLMK